MLLIIDSVRRIYGELLVLLILDCCQEIDSLIYRQP